MIQKLTDRKYGRVYTPELLSRYIAKKTIQYAFADPKFTTMNHISVIDPAIGDGQLLKSFNKQLKNIQNVNFYGIDVDSKAIKNCNKNFNNESISLLKTNSLIPNSKMTLNDGWKKIFQIFNKGKKFDLLIANPPWGADISKYVHKLNKNDFQTLQKGVDTFELFIELATKIVRKDGYFSFIVPDSILNDGKEVIKNILTSNTELKFISRLGEKMFPGINRACVIIICKNTKFNSESYIDCFRLTSEDKKKILDGTMTLSESEKLHSHKIPQSRFLNNFHNHFDIDLKENETKVLQKIKNSNLLGDYLSSTRGVELGISGKVCKCNSCELWSPLSEKNEVICSNCSNKIIKNESEQFTIISSKKIPNSVPIITGKNLKRYVCKPTNWIKLGYDGIGYKSKSTYDSPKILIRKTGVGITAGLDYSSSYTTQVVYILKNRDKNNPDLEFFLSLLNSRLYYFFLAKSFGEIEWRSHPYLTQTQIKNLPLPDLESNENKKIIKQITKKLKFALSKGKLSKRVDLEIELMIGKLFSLDKNDYKIIFDSINESQELLPIKELKNFQLYEIQNKMK
jgi:adenine-specific DNA-methyltransferase